MRKPDSPRKRGNPAHYHVQMDSGATLWICHEHIEAHFKPVTEPKH
jgi:hypothetical protein